MGKPWCADLKVVTVPRADRAKPITLILPFYENHQFFNVQVHKWRQVSSDLRSQVSLIVVDDGSPTPAGLPTKFSRPFPMRLFRIGVDVRWNWIAARNIGAHHAEDGWLLLTDMDHVVSEETLRGVLYGVHDPAVIYGFSRQEHTGGIIGPHPNSWLMTKAMFWKVGGYDETLSGRYGTDGDWRRRCAATAPMQILSDRLTRYEFVSDASTTRYKRKQPEDAAVRKLVNARGKGWKPKVLSFEYHEVSA